MYKLLSHNDLDGVGCGILAKLAFGDQVKVKYNSISALNREIEYFFEHDNQELFLFITDLSPNEENEKKLNDYHQSQGKLQMIDHHKTALHFNEYEWGHVLVEDDEGKLTSATSLLYTYLVNHELLKETAAISEFVELVRQYDTWEWEKNNNQKAKRLNALFFLVSIDEFEEKMIHRLQTSDTFDFDDFEKKLLHMEEEKTERYIRRKKKEIVQAEIGEYLAGVVYAELYHSELGNELGKEYSHLDYIVIVNMGGKKLSFRTIHDHVDVSEIAGQFGGGGHQKASGCSLSDEAYKQFIEETFHLEPLREDAKRNRFNVKKSSFGTLYRNRKDEVFLVYSINDEWVIEKNKNKLEQTFTTFEEGESFLKRNYLAWLVNDDQFVNYLMKQIK
ncbi:DHH family phosphoesterase [Bacillus massiliigorillae]|uniref:DHH family phosphoesterase n=1 Tax=Bacillus massiliigorillae TaxID=1243664 RepID=UPI0003A109D8|nr:DHHA1 domain-containing protein [Bacillus massiliigorillae]